MRRRWRCAAFRPRRTRKPKPRGRRHAARSRRMRCTPRVQTCVIAPSVRQPFRLPLYQWHFLCGSPRRFRARLNVSPPFDIINTSVVLNRVRRRIYAAHLRSRSTMTQPSSSIIVQVPLIIRIITVKYNRVAPYLTKNAVMYLRTHGPKAADRRADRHGVPLGSSVTGCPYLRQDNGGGAGLARAIRMSERRVLSLPVRC